MDDGDATLYLQLHKIPAAAVTEEALAHVLETLWSTRNTGLGPLQKPSLQSLLNLPSLQELDPVLACLRSIIRKTVRQDLSRDDIQKLFPPDLPIELRSVLLVLLQRYQNEWKEEVLRDQPAWEQTKASHQVKVNMPVAHAPFLTPELSSSMWSRKDYGKSSNGSAPAADSNLPCMIPVPIHMDGNPLTDQMILPRLKSLTWTMENRNSAPAHRVAVICLKLQDHTKSSLGEVEVKFQLSRDTLEAMLRSMTHISEQLTNSELKSCYIFDILLCKQLSSCVNTAE